MAVFSSQPMTPRVSDLVDVAPPCVLPPQAPVASHQLVRDLTRLLTPELRG
jgi:hypothetical protein